MAKTFQEEIDKEVLWDIYTRYYPNWIVVELPYTVSSEIETQINDWCCLNLKGMFYSHYNKYAIELPQDSTLFVLRWVE